MSLAACCARRPRRRSCRASAGWPRARSAPKSGPLDLVTDADEAAERVDHRRPAGALPRLRRGGRGGGRRRPALLGALDGADLAFVVDPVDGTANFAAGLPLFGCMAAAVVRGEIVAA